MKSFVKASFVKTLSILSVLATSFGSTFAFAVEKQIEYDEFKKREGEIITGVVKKATKFSCIVAIGSKAEGILTKSDMIFGEKFNEKDRISAHIKEVKRSNSEFQIILSRASNEFLSGLMSEEVPEIKDGLVEIKGVSRHPGSRAKVAVWSSDFKIDPVGACIGTRGSRISNIVQELKGEKIDIVHWDRDFLTFAKNAMVPVKPLKIELIQETSDKELVSIVVANSDLSPAIGKRGQNVRLASQLIGKNIEVVSEEQKQESITKKLKNTSEELIKALDLDDIVAKLLISEGFMSVEQVAESSVEKLASVNGFNEVVASELQSRAKDFVNALHEQYEKMSKKLNFDTRIADLQGLSKKECVTLMEANIITMQDLADLSSDELSGILNIYMIPNRNISRIIMDARKIIYGI